jgi:hypothetical protein
MSGRDIERQHARLQLQRNHAMTERTHCPPGCECRERERELEAGLLGVASMRIIRGRGALRTLDAIREFAHGVLAAAPEPQPAPPSQCTCLCNYVCPMHAAQPIRERTYGSAAPPADAPGLVEELDELAAILRRDGTPDLALIAEAAAVALRAAPQASPPQMGDIVLAEMLADLFGWSDRTYLHAIMHVENAVKNLQATARAAPQAGEPGDVVEDLRKVCDEAAAASRERDYLAGLVEAHEAQQAALRAAPAVSGTDAAYAEAYAVIDELAPEWSGSSLGTVLRHFLAAPQAGEPRVDHIAPDGWAIAWYNNAANRWIPQWTTTHPDREFLAAHDYDWSQYDVVPVYFGPPSGGAEQGGSDA